ncbi:serine/threonine protein kinase [Bacillus sp. B1-b2]|uniref:serine/threonine protein kinase n=1 Tax=Bacillus sp. B1-b2 TaxID=2653201 RepID=UPI001261E2E6|nr:protein kinase [Bacillus sp. B1-b2]KAB7665869.1 protein kinase [Bacillus sp. B1-b2]
MKWNHLTRWIFDTIHKPGTIIGTYKIIKCLGKGGYGIIYLCTDTKGEKFVLKQLRPSKKKKTKEQIRFKEEGKLLMSIDCPAIPGFIQDLDWENQYYYVMEYIKGDNIEEVLFFQDGKFTEKETLLLMCKLLDIMNYLHSHLIFHTDIRPPNVILNEEKLYLIDFGLAKKLSAQEVKEIHNRKQDDFFDFGQMILFMLYSLYTGKKSRKKSWLEELTLTPELEYLLKGLLGITKEYENIEMIHNDLQAAIESVK